MTENTRFNLVGSYLYDGDECISHFDDPKHRDEIVELLNDFYNENEQLKRRNKGLQSELQIFKEDVSHSNLQINKLTDENEQLKQQLKHLRKLSNELYMETKK